MSLIYLDFNRTTPVAPSVVDAMQPYWAGHYLLPDQEHVQAQAVREAVEHARDGLASLAGCEPFEVVFTSGGTEANNLAVLGQCNWGESDHEGAPGHLLVSALEHGSVLRAAQRMTSMGWEMDVVPASPDGIIEPDAVLPLLRSTTKLACIQLANSTLGTIQPVSEIADILASRGVHLHCDATQAFGKIAVDATAIKADTLSISGHKFYGPKGSGAIFVRRGLQLSPIIIGEPCEMGLRAGAENVPGCVGLGAAASMAARCVDEATPQLRDLRDHFANGLLSTLGKDAHLLCEESDRLPNTLAIEMPCEARRIQRAARQLVFATAQCDSPPDEFTRALQAIGKTSAQIGRTIRLSMGWTSSHDQVDQAIELLAAACEITG